MPKFRTMRIDTPVVATHLLKEREKYLIPRGKVLREFSLDELPQLFSVLVGHMTLVGPRPALFNQRDLIQLRTARNIHTLVPGTTGWAQINGRGKLSIPKKVQLDEYYFREKSFFLDAKILFLTIFKVLSREGVLH